MGLSLLLSRQRRRPKMSAEDLKNLLSHPLSGRQWLGVLLAIPLAAGRRERAFS